MRGESGEKVNPHFGLAAPFFNSHFSILNLVLLFLFCACTATSAPSVTFQQSATRVDRFDFIEVTLRISSPPAGNPFTGAEVTGEFAPEGGNTLKVDGFCDSDDGSVFRIRFMPAKEGRHHYTVTYRRGGAEEKHSGSFIVRQGNRKGPVRVDREHPFHFVWEGTGEHFFWNSTTTYALIGWRDDKIIRESIDRLAILKVNRLRAAIIPPRVKGGAQWFEPTVTNDAHFTFCVNAWPAARPDSVDDPGFDTSRFNLAHWQKLERLLAHARKRDVIISVIFYVDGRLPGVDPFRHERMGGEDEQRYYRYAAARFAAFANVMWDVANEYRLFRNDAWAEQMGSFLKECDPYDHLTSVHGHGTFNFRKSPWADFAMYQSWDEHGGYQFMLKNREEQVKLGRPIPQVNEEYGYEDHYPGQWGEGRKKPARSAENRRRLAWEMAMAGGYQTTGERANVVGYGGWINGRGNKEMTMLDGYANLQKFFERLEWWKLEPTPQAVVQGNALCLTGAWTWVIYMPQGGQVIVNVPVAKFPLKVCSYNPRTGALKSAGTLQWESDRRGGWRSPMLPDGEDGVFLISPPRLFRKK